MSSQQIKTSELTINNDLLNFIPRPEVSSRNILLESIKKEGITEPITATYLDNKLTILDGHTRFTIASELGITEVPVEVLEDVKEDLTAIKEKMLTKQLGRRNLSKVDFTVFLGELYKIRTSKTRPQIGKMDTSGFMDKIKASAIDANNSFLKSLRESAKSVPPVEPLRPVENGGVILTPPMRVESERMEEDGLPLSARNWEKPNVAKDLADEFGVSVSSVKRAANLVDNINVIEKVGIADKEVIKNLPQKEINTLVEQVKAAPTIEAKQEVVNNVLIDKGEVKAKTTIVFDDLNPAEQEVIRTLRRDGIAVAKMNNWRKGESQLERYCKQESIYLKIDRKNKTFGNPFYLEDTNDDVARKLVINKYQAYLSINDYVIEQLPTTQGKVLFCHCYPKPCHGDVIKKAALGQFDISNLSTNIINKVKEENEQN